MFLCQCFVNRCQLVIIINTVAVIATEFGVICCVGCNASCPLDEFIGLTQANIPTNWTAECYNTTATTNTASNATINS